MNISTGFKMTERRKLVVAALVVAMLAWLLTPQIVGQAAFDGVTVAQEEPTDAATEATAPPPEPEAPPAIDIEELLGGLPVETYKVFLSRDPFEPVRPQAASGGGGDPTDPTDPTDPVDPGGDLCSDAGASATCEGITVTLLDVSSDANGSRIIVQVEDTLYEVGVDAIFAGSFRVLAITAPCADLLYGDDMFTLCQGDRVLK